MKRLSYFALLSAFLCLAGVNNVYGATSYSISGSGTNKTLTITGSGAMSNYTSGGAPWYSERANIKHIVINEGVTSVGNYAFQGISSSSADVTVPSSITSFGSNAFANCSTMVKIFYAGSPNEWAVIDFANQTAHPFGALSASADYYFYGNTTTKTSTLVLFPPLTQIKQYTFQRINLDGTGNGLSIPGTVETIGNYAFYGCSIAGEVAINRKASPIMGTDAFRGIGTNRSIYVPTGATGYRTSGSYWYFKLTTQAVSGSTLGTYGTDIAWKLSEDGVLILDASNTDTKNITLSAAASLPWRYFRRLVYKVVLKGDISALNSTLRYHYGFSEVILHQQTLPTINPTYIGGTNYASLFNTKDKLILRIPPELEGNAGLSSAPWNDATHWNVVVTGYCANPSSLSASKTGATTATASWTDDRGSAWKYLCLPATTTLTDDMWSSASTTTNKSVNVTSLTPATTYKFYLIADCGATGTSDVLASDEFTTDCDVIAHASLPWSEGFEGGTNNVKPLCWEQLVNNTSKIYANKLASDAHTNNFSLCIYGGKTSQTIITAVFPEFADDISDLELNLWYKTSVTGDGYTYGQPQIGYITDIEDVLTFKGIGSALAQTGSYVHIENVTFASAPSGARIAIQYTGGLDNGYVYIDDITVREKPACNKPTGVAVTADSETAEGATITWNANSMSAWKLQVSEGDAASWGEEIAVATNSKVLTGLKANTLYYVRVKADCGGGSVSEWSDNVSFTTLCGTINVSAASPWSIDFEGLSELIVPDCWDNSASTTTSSWGAGYIWGTYNHTSNTMLAMNNSALDGGTALINSPSFDIPDDGREYELTFDYSNMAIAGNNLKVKISTNGGSFIDKGTYYPSGSVSSYPGTFTSATINLADYSGKTIKVQFFTNPTAGTSPEGGAMFVDNVSVHKVSNCIVPTALAAGNLTANSAQITWTAGGSETAWRLQYRADGGDWSAEQAVSGSAQRNLTGLSANTEYFVRVKAYCDAEDQSNWSDVLSFTTLCAAASMPFSEEFSSASELPSCWEATTTASYGWSAYEKSGAYSVQLRTGSSGEATLRMPSISLSVDAILQFEWKNASGAQVNLYISTDGGTTKTMIPNDLSGVYANWTTKIFDLSAYTDETALIYFVANFSTANQYAYLDDVEVIARPCEMILNIQAAPITGGATISWSGEVKKLQYKTGSDGWSSATIPSGDYAGPKTITNLTPARTYQVRLLPACSEEAEDNWTTPIYFVTSAIESVPYYNNFEAETAGEVPFNWSRISSTEYPQVVYDSYAYVEFGDKGNSVKFYGVNDQILVLPEFDAILSALKISFHYRNRDCTMELGYVEDDGTTFVAIETLPNHTGYAEFPYEKDLYNISSDASKLAIRYSNAGSQAQAWVDNVSVELASCGQPRNLTFSDLTANSVHISWTASERGTESNYQYINKIWSESDPNWSSATLIESNVHELNLTGLTPNKDYEFYLRSYCGTSGQSTPIKIEFKTLVAEEVFEDSPSANNNEARLAALHNQTVNITLNRPLPRNGDYSTICLPFDLTATQIANPDCPLHGFVIKEFDHSGNGEARVNLYLKQVTSIEAGKPYFIRYAGAPTDVALTPLRFLNVKVTASTPAAGEGDECIAQGIFNPHSLVANDQNTLFLSSNNTLYYPTANGTMNGFRVYISVADGSPMHNAIRNGLPISVCEQESTTTTIDSVSQNISTGKGTKIIRNGQLYIIYKGTMYNVQGKRIH